MSVPKAAIGHLSLPGVFKSVLAKMIRAKMLADKDLAEFKNATEIKAEDGRLTITVQP